MTPPGARRLVLLGILLVAVTGVGLAVAGPLTPGEPLRRVAATPSSPRATASATPAASTPPRAAPALPVELPEARPPQVRVVGDDVYETSVSASRAAFPGRHRAAVVYLVSGTSFAEAYGAVPAAALQGGPVLLSEPTRIPRVVASELERLRPSRVVLVGGRDVLGQRVARDAAEQGAKVERVDGAGAEGTSVELARFAFPTARRAWIVAGDRPDHAVVASAAAAATRSPLLVLDARAAGLPAGHAALLRQLGVTSVTVVGSAEAVSTGVVDDLGEVVGRKSVRRADGSDRYAVVNRVNALAGTGRVPGVAYVANPRGLATAFAGASLAGLSRRPLYYALPYCVPSATRRALTSSSVTRVVLLGGERTLRRLVARVEPCRSTTDPYSTWVLVNRRNPLTPRQFTPTDMVVPPMRDAGGHQLRTEAATALARMASAVAAASGRIGIDTAYRSFGTQEALYDKWLARRGRTWTDTWYARPGYSEHQTGLTVDLLPVGESNCTINDCLDETPQGRWLARNSWRFGYILRYEEGYRATVGLGYEPWHFRYVGVELARAYHEGGWHTLESFLDEPAAPTY